MKTNIISIISAMVMIILIQSCHDPKTMVSNGDQRGILSMTAKFVNDESSENSFPADIDYESRTIKIRFPMYYPRASFDELQSDALKNVRVTASLSNNSVIEPALTTLDLTKNNYITVSNPQGVKTRYSVSGEIVELWDCQLEEIELSDGTAGIVDNTNHVVTLLATDYLEAQTATVRMSPHATISPDIETVPFDFNDEDAVLTVTAQNGVDKTEYTIVKGEPKKIPFGFREGSEELRWVKRWNEVGYTKLDAQTGFAVTDRYLVLNEKGTMQAVVLKASDGSDTGKRLDMSIIPNGMNHNMTSDNAGHILVNSRYGDPENTFKIWLFKDIDDKGELFINVSAWGASERISVYGDVTKDAVIYAPLSGSSIQVVRWFIKNGVVGPSEIITLSGVGGGVNNVDIAPTSATDPNADFYAVFYATANGKRGPVLYNGANKTISGVGKTNTKKRNESDGGLTDAGNWIMNACDYVEFNKSKYFMHNSVNTFTWGRNDYIYLLDVSVGDFSKELFMTNEHNGAVSLLVDVSTEDSLYGAMAAGNVGKAVNCNDARLWVSDTGFYMYGYFLFTNGYIGCIRVDCIKY